MPAWSDRNLRSLASHVVSPLFLAHVRSTTGTRVQQTNCHPFRHEHWLFLHNGSITDYLETPPRASSSRSTREFFGSMLGTTDSEVMFCLALTFQTSGSSNCKGEDRAVVSEPLSDLPGMWIAVPESTALAIQDGPDDQRAFTPQTP